MAGYNDIIGLYVTARYQGKSTGPWRAETWQAGWRLGLFNQLQATPGPDSGLQTLAKYGVNDASVTRDTSNFHVQQNFTGTGTPGTLTDNDSDGIADAIWNYLVSLKNHMSDQYEFESIRIYPFGTDGLSRTGPNIYTQKATTLNGTGTTALPPQCSFVVSTQSAGRGRQTRGRWYLGGLDANCLSPQGFWKDNLVTSILSPAHTLLQGLTKQVVVPPSASFRPVIWHNGTNQAHVIQKVRANVYLDTQRRRARSIVSAYQSENLTV